MPSAESIEVTIFNQTYVLRSPSGDEHVRRIASLVDERMRQIASSITTHDVSKIAILAALNIADEMQNIKERYAPEPEQPPAEMAEERGGKGAAAQGGRTPTEPGTSWFDEIFEGEMTTTRDRGSRLSSQVSAKLQSLRRSDTPSPAVEESEPPRRT
jgi:cell division protein ZapA